MNGQIRPALIAPSFFWGQLAASAVPAVAGLFGAGGPSREEKQLLAAQARQMDRAGQFSSTLAPRGQRLLGEATRTLAQPRRYYSTLLGGDRAAMTETLAPELGAITDAYRGAIESQAQLTPRGGGRATILQAAPYQQARDVSTLFQTVRPAAAQGLERIGQQYGALGTGTLQNAINALYANTSAGAQALAAQDAIRKRQYEQSRELGRSLYQMGQGILGSFGQPSRPKISSIFNPEGGPMLMGG